MKAKEEDLLKFTKSVTDSINQTSCLSRNWCSVQTYRYDNCVYSLIFIYKLIFMGTYIISGTLIVTWWLV